MKYVAIFIVFVTSFLQKTYTQLQADNWIFTPTIGINFNGATNPTTFNMPATPISQQVFGATVCYSDKQGNLLFYGTQGQLYDKNFQRFPSTDYYGGTALFNCYNIIYTPSQTALAPDFVTGTPIFQG